jgi:serine/threonine kinase 16
VPYTVLLPYTVLYETRQPHTKYPSKIMLTLQQYAMHWIQSIISWLQSLWERMMGPVIKLDSGIQVRVGKPLAEGGFSVVLRATNVQEPHQVYALKRILCQEAETRQACLAEADVHRAVHNSFIMPLLGMAFEDNDKTCYMLFPLLPHSLRDEVNQRIFLPKKHCANPRPPWSSESTVLKLFSNLCQAVAALHEADYSHRDIKLENILLPGSNPTTHLISPLLMDFGSAGPKVRSLQNRRDVLEISDEASSHTTLPYRPPELFAGEVRVGDEDLDYTKVDVWMLGCTLFAILYGASPFECEFSRRRAGQIKIVECGLLRILGDIPKPPPETPPSKWYSPQVLELVEFILQKDRRLRPTLPQVQARVEALWNPNHQDLEDPMKDLVFSSRNLF